MVDFSYLYKGLCGLARAHQANTMAGHLGATLAAGYFFGEEHQNVDERVHAAIEKELDRVVAGEEAFWFDPKKAGVTIAELFEGFPDERPQTELISTIAQALADNIDKTRESGHNVIFASIALRALHDHSMYATPSIIGGIRKLVAGFNRAGPGQGYYGKDRGWVLGNDVSLEKDDRFPPYRNEAAMVEVVMDELIQTASVRRQGFGGLWHIINHAAALTELSRFGYQELARKGLAAHHHHVRLWRSLPDVEAELGAVPLAQHDAREPEFWTTGSLKRDSARLTHRIKTLYGFFTLVRFVEDDSRRQLAEQKLRYLM
jgi:hypothetical protein